MAHGQPLHTKSASLALFDIELDDLDSSTVTASDILQEALLRNTTQQSASEDQNRLLYDAQQAQVLSLSPSGEVDLHTFACQLALHGHLVWLRTGRPDCCCGQVALRHTFVVAAVAGCNDDPVPQLFVVDPCFRDSFQLPNATPEYRGLWETLPSLFVGTAEQLLPIVELMCAQMQKVFADTATSCPPWRTASTMLTKWLPSAADDVPVIAPSSSSSDTSTHTSSGGSALSSPAAAAPSSSYYGMGAAGLAPIRTDTPCCGAGGDPFTPHSSRSPLYFDQDEAPASHLVFARSPGAGHGHLGSTKYAAAGDQDGASIGWGRLAVDPTTGVHHSSNGSYFVAAAQLQTHGTFSSSSSSPAMEYPISALRGYFSEDGSGCASDSGGRGKGVAIAPRRRLSMERGSSGNNGFAEAFAARAVLQQLSNMSLDVAAGSPMRALGSRNGQQAVGVAAGSNFIGSYRSRVNATLDISRFDHSAMDELSTGPPLMLGLPGDRLVGGAHSSSKPPGSVCPPAVRRRSGNSFSSQCSALSAAIAGKAIAPR